MPTRQGPKCNSTVFAICRLVANRKPIQREKGGTLASALQMQYNLSTESQSTTSSARKRRDLSSCLTNARELDSLSHGYVGQESERENNHPSNSLNWMREMEQFRAENEGARGDRHSKLTAAKMSKVGGLHLVQGLTGLQEALA